MAGTSSLQDGHSTIGVAAMWKFYYAPISCALASHMALEQAGAKYEAVRVDFTSNAQGEHHAADRTS
jgi:hypothetical protein